MRSAAMLAVVALLAVTLAGCSSTDPERYSGDVPDGSGSRSTSSSPTSTWPPASSSSASAAPAANGTGHAPVGSLQATVNGTSAVFELNGTDADGDAIAWTLDLGDGNQTNGTALPSVQAHNYTLPANVTTMNVTVRFALSDGVGNATYNATLLVGTPVPKVVATVSWQVGSAWCLAQGAAPPDPAPSSYTYPSRAAGNLYGELLVDAAWAGKPFAADFGEAASPVDQGVVAFYDSGKVLLASADSGMPGAPPAPPAAPEPFAMLVSGTVPAAAAYAVFSNCGNPEGITATFTVG
jgi:hypothetical protein